MLLQFLKLELLYVYFLICMSVTQAFRSTSTTYRHIMQRGMTSTGIDNNWVLPELVVFDMDMCLWSPEMYTLDTIPTLKDAQRGKLGDKGEGVVAVSSGYEDIQIFPAALMVLQDFYEGKYGSKMRIAAASSADTPRAVSIGRAAMGILEVIPGVTLRQCFAKGWEDGFDGNLQIGRTPPLSSDKAETHFPILQRETNVPYAKMLFFDDCNWGDHCANVERNCPGVVTMRTPRGLQEREWKNALAAYHQRYGGTSSNDN